MANPIRYEAVISTPEGIILVKDRKDKYLVETVNRVQRDRKKTREQIDHALEIIRGPESDDHEPFYRSGKYSLPGGKAEPKDLDGKDTAARELIEELGLLATESSVHEIMTIKGRVRDHVLYVIHAQGMITLDPKESITGIGFLRENNTFPMEHHFFQSHVINFYKKYFSQGYAAERQALEKNYMSTVRVPESLLRDWQRDELHAQLYRNSPNTPAPQNFKSSPNFTIIGDDGRPKPFYSIPTIAKTQAPLPDSQRFKIKRTKSDQDVQAVQAPPIKIKAG